MSHPALSTTLQAMSDSHNHETQHKAFRLVSIPGKAQVLLQASDDPSTESGPDRSSLPELAGDSGWHQKVWNCVGHV